MLKTVRCLVTGCLEVAHNAGCMREDLMYRHFFSRIAVVQEGREPLPCCDMCGIHILEDRIIKHQWSQWCDQNTQMWWQRRDVAVASRCVEAFFSLTGEDEAECTEGLETFKYL